MLTRQSRRLIDRLLTAPRARLLAAAGVFLVVIAWLDWLLGHEVTLGAFYIVPVVLLSGALSRMQILVCAVFCSALRVVFNPPPTIVEGIMNGGFAVVAYALIGLFTSEMVKNRKEILDHLTEIHRQQALRRDAEEQLRFLAETSPAAIFTVNEDGQILSANRATRELLRLEKTSALIGQAIDGNLPVLAEALKLDTRESFRTMTQVQGNRCDGTPFLAQVCFSTYRADDGSARLAAIAFDSTEDTREREEHNQLQMQESNRIIAGAVAHEVRNVCSAMSVVCSNLENIPGVVGTRDYQALEHLVMGLGKLARLELHGQADSRGNSADVRDVLSHLRILIGPAWEEEGAQIDWPDLPRPLLVAADSFTLLQAFLNLANNSLSAVSLAAEKRLTVVIETGREALHVCFRDTGGGVSDPISLFQPFRTGSGRVGLGLYVSRALMRRYGGDVRYETAPDGPQFIVEAPLYGVITNAAQQNKRNPALAGR